MTVYWIMFTLAAILAVAASPRYASAQSQRPPWALDPLSLVVATVLTSLIGFRFEVGGDWFNYLRHFETVSDWSWQDAFSKSEFGHWALNKLMSDIGWGVTGVNAAYAGVFTVGLIRFCRTLPRPWLALSAAIPYLVIVVAMGYSRQAVALGFAVIGILSLYRGGYIAFGVWVLAGATFHNSAVILIPIAGLIVRRNRVVAISAVALITWVGYESLLNHKIEQLIDVYVERQLTSSDGSFIRLSMNAIAGGIFLAIRKRIATSPVEGRLWSVISLLSIAMLVAYFVTGLSTALDRMALYFIPLQMVAAAHLPDAIGRLGRRNVFPTLLILTYFFSVQFVWLNLAGHAFAWLPYQIGISQ